MRLLHLLRLFVRKFAIKKIKCSLELNDNFIIFIYVRCIDWLEFGLFATSILLFGAFHMIVMFDVI